MNIHTVLVTYNRLDLTKQALASYLETVTGPFSLTVVDNGSSDGTREWLMNPSPTDFKVSVILLPENKYPGYACNRGWEQAPPTPRCCTAPTTTGSSSRIGKPMCG